MHLAGQEIEVDLVVGDRPGKAFRDPAQLEQWPGRGGVKLRHRIRCASQRMAPCGHFSLLSWALPTLSLRPVGRSSGPGRNALRSSRKNAFSKELR